MSPTESSRNRRGSRRRPAKGSTKALFYRGPMGLGSNLAVSVLEVSERGASLVVKQPIAVGAEVEVNLEGVNHRRPIRSRATVVWCLPTSEARWCLGVRFEKWLRYSDLSELTRL